MSSMWPGMKWVWNEQSFAHGQPARWLSAGRDRYKSWAIVGSLLVFGGSLMPLLSLSNIANAQGPSTTIEREREKESMRMLYMCVSATRRARMCVCVCMRSRGGVGAVERSRGLRWISGTHIYPSVAERDTGIGNGGGTCEHGGGEEEGQGRVREREVTPTV